MQAPYTIVVHGPEQVGKSTLIKSLVKHYTKQNLIDVQGGITVRSGKYQRLTFYECPNDMTAMVDLGKIADLALILIDAEKGFQLVTFEFLNILQAHGFPCVMGVLTHLDSRKQNKSLNKTKNEFKKRFWKEVYDGAKLFYISNLQDELYNTREIHNLARFLSVMKYPKIQFRQKHSFVFVDRYEISPFNDSVLFYGYIRGRSFNPHDSQVFVTGLGKFPMVKIQEHDDPCIPLVLQKKKKSLKMTERVLHAPYSNVGTLKFDRSTGYITIPDQYVHFTEKENERENKEPGVKMVREMMKVEQTIDQQLERTTEVKLLSNFENSLKIDQNTNEELQKDTTQELIEKVKEKSLRKKQKKLIQLEQNIVAGDLTSLIYPQGFEKEEQLDDRVKQILDLDCSRCLVKPLHLDNIDDYINEVKPFFMAGNVMEDIDLLEEEEKQIQKEEEEEKKEGNDKFILPNEEKLEEEGMIKAGIYVKIEVSDISKELAQLFNPLFPIIVCALSHYESSLGFLKVKLKKHRWHEKILKSNDPLIISLGWQRFQTLPIYCTQDRGTERLRMIKYTPLHSHCIAIFYGPLVPLNTTLIGIQYLHEKLFRIAATGIVIEIDHSFQIQKKLKLIGEPFRVFKHTAFIKNMFNSELEVAKFKGAKIRSVSGIRGQIKKPLSQEKGPQGSFRATFEDRILMSDIVFVRTFYNVSPEAFYNPLTSYGDNNLLRTTKQLRDELQLKVQFKQDSQYQVIEREQVDLPAFRIPKKLQMQLPFEAKQKLHKKKSKEEDEQDIMLNDKEKKVQFLLEKLETIRNARLQAQKDKLLEREKIKAKAKEKEDKVKQESLRKRIKRRKVKEDRSKKRKL